MSMMHPACTARVRRATATALRPNWPSGIAKAIASVLVFGTLLCASQPAAAQLTQQGSKLVGTGALGAAQEGDSVAVSADGSTAIVGGFADNSYIGAAWVFTRSGSTWTQQGSKLVGTGAVGTALQGLSVALSADGNTAIVGGAYDNSNVGAAWVFTRSSGSSGVVWTQQGSKLVGTGVAGAPYQGWSVGLSADGNTAIVGGYQDNSVTGAAWVFTRSGGVWTQQGSKLVGTGAVGQSWQGYSIALSGDGNTAIMGGIEDNNGIGAAWVFTRSGGVWTQQGSKLVGTGAVGSPVFQSRSVALSADGNIAFVGGYQDNSSIGAAWVFTRSGGVWTQQGSKLVGTGAVGEAAQGASVALSADGNSLIVGGPLDNSSIGAAWVFTQSGGVWTQQGSKLVGTGAVGLAEQGVAVALSADGTTAIVGGDGDNSDVGAAWVFASPNFNAVATHDFNGDGYSDIAWRDTSGDNAIWLMNGSTILSSAGLGTIATAWSIVGQRDFNGDGKADLLWHDTSGDIAIWFMNGTSVTSGVGLGTVNPVWSIVGTGDFNGDGKGDILWRDTSGDIAMWLMNGSTILSGAGLGSLSTAWSVVGTGDFNGNGKSDILWEDNSGDIAIWFMNGTTVTSGVGLGTIPPPWTIVGTGDFNGDGMTDILWRNTSSGAIAVWLMNGSAILSGAGLGSIATTWSVAETGDFNGDGMSDILWHDTSGDVAIWFMNGTTVTSGVGLGTIPPSWSIQGAGAD